MQTRVQRIARRADSFDVQSAPGTEPFDRIMPRNAVIAYCPDRSCQRRASGRNEQLLASDACPDEPGQPGPAGGPNPGPGDALVL